MSTLHWHVHADAAALAAAVAEVLVQAVTAAWTRGEVAYLALAGGRTAPPICRALAARLPAAGVLHIAPTDERWVAAGHPDHNLSQLQSSFACAACAPRWLGLVPESPQGVADAAFACSQLQRVPAWDAVMLGMGGDGHFASLFPGAPQLPAALELDAPMPAWAILPNPLPAAGPHPRISLGLARLLATRHLLLVITGADKRALLEAALDPAADPLQWPVVALLRQTRIPLHVHWSP